jgi:hypothetical protein
MRAYSEDPRKNSTLAIRECEEVGVRPPNQYYYYLRIML